MSLSSAGAALAQDVPNRESALEIRKRYLMDLDTLQSKFLALAEAIPAEKYAWRPAPGVRSVGEAFMHVASEYYVYAPMSYGATRSPVIPPGPDAFKTSSRSRPSPTQEAFEGRLRLHEAVNRGLDPAAITGMKKLFGGDRTIVGSISRDDRATCTSTSDSSSRTRG